jgi:hypothetical protein
MVDNAMMQLIADRFNLTIAVTNPQLVKRIRRKRNFRNLLVGPGGVAPPSIMPPVEDPLSDFANELKFTGGYNSERICADGARLQVTHKLSSCRRPLSSVGLDGLKVASPFQLLQSAGPLYP